jgi:hypothetical protein
LAFFRGRVLLVFSVFFVAESIARIYVVLKVTALHDSQHSSRCAAFVVKNG